MQTHSASGATAMLFVLLLPPAAPAADGNVVWLVAWGRVSAVYERAMRSLVL